MWRDTPSSLTVPKKLSISAEVPNCSSRQIPIAHPTAMREEISTPPERRESAFCWFNGCDGSDPLGIGGRSAQLAIEQMRSGGIALGGPSSPTFALCADPPLLHQTSDAEAITSPPALLQLRVKAWAARDPSVRLEDGFSLLCQHLVFLCPFGDFSLAPSGIATDHHTSRARHISARGSSPL